MGNHKHFTEQEIINGEGTTLDVLAAHSAHNGWSQATDCDLLCEFIDSKGLQRELAAFFKAKSLKGDK